ncbi:hypothetical protein P1X14_07420 [Sphingomonas sp. AOB5]|uniref:hypothetical protein n=1 Tax=Sphingomonas sp. AOB5 TaxID=3034017 RepID=UPI0023F92F8F|nr:hypothetical protein [Sphingomonas sp. AOB5]MDF7775070.1 hypothetical protein [Sphingomonas sp. AOB5]
MRAILSKVAAVSMIAGAGLLVTACGKTETTATVNNTVEEVSTVNVTDEMTGTVDAANSTTETTVTSNTVETSNAM